MRVSAVFVVNETAIKKIKEKSENERLNYVLGRGDDTSFGIHIVAMDEFMETPRMFYSIMKKEWPFINENNMQCLCKQANYSIFIIPPEDLHTIQTAFKMDMKDSIEESLSNVNLNIFKSDDERCSIYLTIKNAIEFRSIIAKGIVEKNNVLFVFAM